MNINYFTGIIIFIGSILYTAARFGYLNVVTWLVDFKQCNYLEKAQNGVTPVHLAAAKGSINCLKWLSQTHPRYNIIANLKS